MWGSRRLLTLREGAVMGPMDAMYHCPYHVLVQERKKLLLEMGATRTWISVDRLKPHTAQTPPRGGPRKL